MALVKLDPGRLPTHNHDDRYYTESEVDELHEAPYYTVWTATEGQTVFEDMAVDPEVTGALTVIVGHVLQPKSGAYSFDGTTLTLSEGVAAGVIVEAIILKTAVVGIVGNGIVPQNQISFNDTAAFRDDIGVGSMSTRDVTISTEEPSGGSDGDVWFLIEE